MGGSRGLRVCLLLAAVCVMLAMPVRAESRHEREFYLGASAFAWLYANDRLEDRTQSIGFQARSGYQATRYLGMELRYSDGGKGNSGAREIRVDQAFSALLTLSAAFGNGHRVGVYAGHTTAGLTAAPTMDAGEETEHGVSTGTYINLSLSGRAYVFADYGTWLWDRDFVAQGFNLGLGARF